MLGVIVICVIPIIITLFILYSAWKEVLCVFRNPFPVFQNGDKRFSEIEKHVTRSILKDIGKYEN